MISELEMYIFQSTLRCEFDICLSKRNFLLQAYGQNTQLKGFSPVWTIMCLLMSLDAFMIFGQKGQPNCWGPIWIGVFCKQFEKKCNLISKTGNVYLLKYYIMLGKSCLQFWQITQYLISNNTSLSDLVVWAWHMII